MVSTKPSTEALSVLSPHIQSPRETALSIPLSPQQPKHSRRTPPKWVWKPKPSTKPIDPVSKPLLCPRRPSTLCNTSTTKQTWIPKSVLQAQGYYTGNRHLWIPKQAQPKPKVDVSSPALTKPNLQPQTIWQPKPLQELQRKVLKDSDTTSVGSKPKPTTRNVLQRKAQFL